MAAHILLVQPRVCAEPAYPLGLASLVPALESVGHTVEGIDLHFDAIQSVVSSAHKATLVGITCLTRSLPQVKHMIRAIRASHNPVRIVLGGPHPTLFPHESLRETGADAVVVGDGEEILPQLLEKWETPIPGVTWQTTEGIWGSAPATPRPLDEAAFADRRVFPMARYSHAMRSMDHPYTTVVTSRGCRRHCTWCPSPRLRPAGFMARSPEHVYGEWEWLSKVHGIRDIHLEDDDPFADLDRIHRLCDLLIQRPLPLIWECVNGVPIERLPLDILPKLSAAGCRMIVVSLERLFAAQTPQTRRSHHPAVSHTPGEVTHVQREEVARAKELIAAASRAGIVMGGYFMLGVPGECWRDMLTTLKLSYRIGLTRANYSPFQWLPGAELESHQAGLLPQTPSARGATAISALAHVGFYLHPTPLRQLLADIRRHPAVIPSLLMKVGEQLTGRAGQVIESATDSAYGHPAQ